jgi:hypothetical protein
MIPQEKAQKTINGATYVVDLIDTTAGIRLGARLVNMLGAAAKGSDATLQGVLSGLAANPELGDHLEAFNKAFAKATQVVVNEQYSFTLADKFERHFAGHYDAWLSWFEFAFETNLSSFLGALRPYLDQIAAMQAAAAQAKTGASGFKSPSPASTSG